MSRRIHTYISCYIAIIAFFTITANAQSPDGSYVSIIVYGDAGAKALMQFGNHAGNTRTLDSANSLDTWKENEPPPPGPGFDAIWGPITPNQFGTGIRGLIGRDFRGIAGGATQVDTFDITLPFPCRGPAEILIPFGSYCNDPFWVKGEC